MAIGRRVFNVLLMLDFYFVPNRTRERHKPLPGFFKSDRLPCPGFVLEEAQTIAKSIAIME
jgi:hypothetical protein